MRVYCTYFQLRIKKEIRTPWLSGGRTWKQQIESNIATLQYRHLGILHHRHMFKLLNRIVSL